MANNKNTDIEIHPWEPFIPEGAKVLIMGTFPPGQHRWSMDFYYPNPTNDFWRIMSLIYLGDKDALYSRVLKRFDVDAVRQLATEHHIALNDTAREIRRLKGNASDKFLEILKPVPLFDILSEMPECSDVATTGEKAAEVIATLTGTAVPRMGEYVEKDGIRYWRMPSTSRAYPMKLEEKAAFYMRLLQVAGCMPDKSESHELEM